LCGNVVSSIYVVVWCLEWKIGNGWM
jgi:hypothetical protein